MSVEMSLKEAITIVEKSHPYATKYKGVKEDEALQKLVEVAKLLEQVEKYGIEKEEFYDIKLTPCEMNHEEAVAYLKGMTYGFSEAVDTSNAHLIKKLDAEEIERIVISCKKQTEASCPHCNKNSTWTQINSYELSQAIITHLTKNDS